MATTPADPMDRNIPGQDCPWPRESLLDEIYPAQTQPRRRRRKNQTPTGKDDE